MNSNTYNKPGFYLLKGLKIAALVLIFGFLFGSVVMWLWNTLMPTIFGLTTVTFWQALGLLVLAKIFFGGFGRGGGHPMHRWKNRMRNKWSHMDPSEREAMKEKFKHKFGRHFDHGEGEDENENRSDPERNAND